MLVAAAADKDLVIHRALVLIALVCCTLVTASFALFADGQIAGASKHQQTELADRSSATPASTRAGHHPAQPRRFIDGAASDLTSPFHSIVHTNNQWAVHLVPTILALLVYGLGLGYLARYARGLD
jgi:hypothetical protein